MVFNAEAGDSQSSVTYMYLNGMGVLTLKRSGFLADRRCKV